MELHPRLRREIQISGQTDAVSTMLASELPKAGITVQQHLPGIRILGHAFRPASFSMGQEIRVDFRAVGPSETIAFIESRFHFPGFDFTHENERNVMLVEGLLGAQKA